MEEISEIGSRFLKETIDLLINGDCEIKSANIWDCVSFTIIVDRSEYGKVCGSRGKMIKALKHLWEVCIARGLECPIRITLQEPSHGFAKGRSAEVPSEMFNSKSFREIISITLKELCGLDCNIKEQSHKGEEGAVLHVYKIEMKDTPTYISREFYDAFTTVFFAIAKANGGHIFLDWNG